MLNEIVKSFEINKGDVVYLSSDIIKLAEWFKKRTGHRFEPLELLELFKNEVGSEGTLLLPTFCFDFSNKGTYDYNNSKGITGTLGNVALFKDHFLRTTHPMHSFAVFGADAAKLVSMKNRHSFGIDSPFDYLRVKNAKQIMLGTDYRHSMTFIHYVETLCNVPYRYPKTFYGKYIDSNGVVTDRSYDYAARLNDIETIEVFNKMGEIFESEGVSKVVNTKLIPGYISYIVKLGDSFNYIKRDIAENKCRNIYDFSVPRDEVFKGYRLIW